MRQSRWIHIGVVLATIVAAAQVGCQQRVTAVRWGGVGSEVGYAKGEQAEQLWGGYGAGIKGSPRRPQRDDDDDDDRRARWRDRDNVVDVTDPAAMEALRRRAEQK